LLLSGSCSGRECGSGSGGGDVHRGRGSSGRNNGKGSSLLRRKREAAVLLPLSLAELRPATAVVRAGERGGAVALGIGRRHTSRSAVHATLESSITLVLPTIGAGILANSPGGEERGLDALETDHHAEQILELSANESKVLVELLQSLGISTRAGRAWWTLRTADKTVDNLSLLTRNKNLAANILVSFLELLPSREGSWAR